MVRGRGGITDLRSEQSTEDAQKCLTSLISSQVAIEEAVQAHGASFDPSFDVPSEVIRLTCFLTSKPLELKLTTLKAQLRGVALTAQ